MYFEGTVLHYTRTKNMNLSQPPNTPRFGQPSIGSGSLSTSHHTSDDTLTMDQSVIVSLDNIHKTYLLGIEGVAALRGVSLKVFKGEWLIIYGTSGGGKTSLLNIIGTIDKPTKGDLTVCTTNINPRTKDEELAKLRMEKLGFVFQSFNLIASMSALENVELPMKIRGALSTSERRSIAKASLESVGLSHRLGHFPNQLSGGEQQRVTIARAIANQPELLLLDEPTGDLDSVNGFKIIELLYKLNEDKKVTMVMTTHDMHIKNFAHRVIWMRDGKIAKEEVIPKERRLRALMDLKSKLEMLTVHKHPTLPNEPQSHDLSGEFEVRRPEDYETFSPKSVPSSQLHRISR